jgi:GNAT superfamily N-acetyltransferase
MAVGWCQLTPRDALPCLDRTWRLKRVDDVPVWSLSCFYVRKGCRRQGVTSVLIAAALKAARKAKAALEAYPLDAELTPSASGTGFVSTFARAGFQDGCPPRAASPNHAPRPEGNSRALSHLRV